MKTLAVNLLIICLIITVFPGSGICNVNESSRFNEPDPNTPWPVAFSLGGMNVSHTLMNSYGDPNGTWADACFHAGIDIDATTGDPYPCNEVRSVADGYATLIQTIEISEDVYEWVVIICDELGGVTQRGWSYGHLTQPGFLEGAYVAQGQLIGYMTENITYPHLHFMWSDWNNNWHSWVNPLKYLDPTPTSEDNFTWTFNPLENDPPFKYFFLPQIWYSDWEDLSVGDTEQLMLDPDLLFGDVDFFFGIALRGDGMPGGMGTGRNDLAAQKIKYSVVRELADGEQTLETRHVVDFDCVLASTPGVELRAQMLYFRHSMLSMFGKDGLLYCLSNSERTSSDWDGINTIAERYWNTNAYSDGSGNNVNPVLAMYPDGEYRLDVTCYSFDEDVIILQVSRLSFTTTTPPFLKYPFLMLKQIRFTTMRSGNRMYPALQPN